MDDHEFGIAHVAVALTGVNDLGSVVRLSTMTDAYGNYRFAGLRPGVYSIVRGASPFFANGADTVGTLGGLAQGLQIGRIVELGGLAGQNYNFGQLIKPGCVLTTPAFRAIVASDPHPTGPGGPSAFTRRAYPTLVYWLPELAAELGLRG